MATEEAPRAIYQLHILLLKMSPAIWRRVLVPSDQSLADLHHTLQIVMGWDDTHLHRFLIHGKAHGISREGGLCISSNPKQIRLSDLHLQIKERFLYEYDFEACWQHQVRLERILPFHPTKTSPVCIGGARQAPPEWCNGALAYLEHKQYYSLGHIERRLLEIVEDEEARVGEYGEEAATMLFWLQAETFDRSAVNDRLALFAAGDARWRETEKETIRG
jgi:Plasmid pRiA4b ORF-3-like protein